MSRLPREKGCAPVGAGLRVGRQSCLRHTAAAAALLPWSKSIITVFLPVHYHAFVSQRIQVCRPSRTGPSRRQPRGCIRHLPKKRGTLMSSHRLPCPEFVCCGARTHGQHVTCYMSNQTSHAQAATPALCCSNHSWPSTQGRPAVHLKQDGQLPKLCDAEAACSHHWCPDVLAPRSALLPNPNPTPQRGVVFLSFFGAPCTMTCDMIHPSVVIVWASRR